MSNNSKENIKIGNYNYWLWYLGEYRYSRSGSLSDMYDDMYKELKPLESINLDIKFVVPKVVKADETGRLTFLMEKSKVKEKGYYFLELR